MQHGVLTSPPEKKLQKAPHSRKKTLRLPTSFCRSQAPPRRPLSSFRNFHSACAVLRHCPLALAESPPTGGREFPSESRPAGAGDSGYFHPARLHPSRPFNIAPARDENSGMTIMGRSGV